MAPTTENRPYGWSVLLRSVVQIGYAFAAFGWLLWSMLRGDVGWWAALVAVLFLVLLVLQIPAALSIARRTRAARLQSTAVVTQVRDRRDFIAQTPDGVEHRVIASFRWMARRPPEVHVGDCVQIGVYEDGRAAWLVGLQAPISNVK